MSRILFVAIAFMLSETASEDNNFGFRRKLDNVNVPGWFDIEIDPAIQEKVKDDLADIRLYHIHEKDTTEVPFVIRVSEDKQKEKEFKIQVLNRSNKDGKLYLTFRMPKEEKINQILFDFEEPDFDGRVKLEGSEDRKEWFTISEGNRIVALSEPVSFKSTTVNFPLSSFSYLRAEISADKNLNFLSASIKRRETSIGEKIEIPLTTKSTVDKKSKVTIVDVSLPHNQFMSSLSIHTENNDPYFRPMQVEVLEDSTKTSAGWQYYYRRIFSGHVTSLDSNVFTWNAVKGKHARIIISNADNEPLTLSAIKAHGPRISLTAKIQPGENFLFYGAVLTESPHYDIKHFDEQIPGDSPLLRLGGEEDIRKAAEKDTPLFERKIWLWAIMGIIIAILGFFTLRMMRTTAAP